MARNNSKLNLDEVDNALIQMNIRLDIETKDIRSKLDHRKNILADYSSAFSSDFLITNVLELIRQELEDEILKELRKDERTIRLADGLFGQTIAEKRRGTWTPIPMAKVTLRKAASPGARDVPLGGTDTDSPILIQAIDHGDFLELTIRLNHPLYIVLHTGVREHMVPPRKTYHVFPTRRLIEQQDRAKWSHYGPGIFNLRDVKSRDPDASPSRHEDDVEKYVSKSGKVLLKPRRPRLKIFTKNPIKAKAIPPTPFITLAWRRVIRRNKRRTQETITKRMQGRNII